MVTVHFSDIEKEIIESITSAKAEVRIAIAWFNNSNIFDCLIRCLPNVAIYLLLANDKNNYTNGIDFTKLISAGARVYLHAEDKLMHNKYLIIDRRLVITGSYNFTFGAEYSNRENIVVFKDEPTVTSEFLENFDLLIEKSSEAFDFDAQINKSDDVLKYLIGEPVSGGKVVGKNKSNITELDFVAHEIINQYNSGNIKTTGRAILSLVEDNLSSTGNQKILKAAYLTYISTGENHLAKRCLKKIEHRDIQGFERLVSLVLEKKLKLGFNQLIES